MVGSRGEFKNTVLLLDDLGVYLHRSGQRDLVATLERIAKSNQIVFSTHSPFMVDREKLMRIRIISKKEGKGTCIRSPRGRDQ
jgi:predicted ATP-binding protein involved in virulence